MWDLVKINNPTVLKGIRANLLFCLIIVKLIILALKQIKLYFDFIIQTANCGGACGSALRERRRLALPHDC